MTSIVIVGLGAVVILIIVVVLAAMHYLRADHDDDFDDLPDERVSGGMADRDRHLGIRRPGRDAHQPLRSPADERRRPGRDADRHDDAQRGGRDYRDRPARHHVPSRDYADERDYAGRRGSRPSAGAYDDRRASGASQRPQDSQRRQDDLPAVRPRSARGKKSDDGDWPSTEWDELSDVDYWAEVASDKPLTTTAQPASGSGRAGRPGRDGKTESRPGQARPAQPRSAQPRPAQPHSAQPHSAQPHSAQPHSAQPYQAQRGRPDPAQQQESAPRLPVRAQRQPAIAAPQAAARAAEFSAAPLAAPHQAQPDAASSRGGDRGGQRGGIQHSEQSLAMLASLGGQQRPADYADDDPLTSPSFPAIPAEDSRSYRNGRSRSAAASSHRSPAPPVPGGPAAYNAATQQLAAYAPAHGQLDGYGPGQPGAGAEPGGYRQPAAAAESVSQQPYPAAPPAAAGYPGHNGNGYGSQADPLAAAAPGPAGNPYGSYVSSPAQPGLPDPASGLPGGVPARYDGYPAGQGSGRPAAAVSYPVLPSGGQVPVPGAPVPGAGAPGTGSGNGNGWYPAADYTAITQQPALPGGHEAGYPNGNGQAGLNGYQSGPEQGGYLPAGYAGSHDPGHAGPDPYDRDPYGGYPGYGTGR